MARSRAEVLAYLERYLVSTPERAAKRLEFISHPLWRTYVFVYFEGERLLRRWLELVPARGPAGALPAAPRWSSSRRPRSSRRSSAA